MTRLKLKTDNAHKKAKQSSLLSSQANRRAKKNFYDSVNSTLKDNTLSPKIKFKILTRLMMNNKISSIPPLVDKEKQ